MAYETIRACRACRQTVGDGCVCANPVPALRPTVIHAVHTEPVRPLRAADASDELTEALHRSREVTVAARVVDGFHTNGVLTLVCETPTGSRFHVTPADGDTITPKEAP